MSLLNKPLSESLRRGIRNVDAVFLIFVLAAFIFLAFLPTGFPRYHHPDSIRTQAVILEVDNQNVFNIGGVILQGVQHCKVEITRGVFKGKQVAADNFFSGRLEFDKVFEVGDRALAVIDYTGDTIHNVTLIDHYRIDVEVVLFALFILLLLIFARWTGAKAILSFFLSILVFWKILAPGLLRGWNPVVLSLCVVVFLTVVILLLVGGISQKSLAAILGSLSGTLLTCILALVFGRIFNVHGAVLPYSETLLYAGYAHLNLTQILVSVVFIASAGALMDLSMDISAAVDEIVQKNPAIATKEAIASGINVGRAVVGTMTTTLLFAYIGGYMAMLMVLMAQGTPVIDIFNLRYVSKEIMHTILGSFGLVTVAPFTAIIAGILFTRRKCS